MTTKTRLSLYLAGPLFSVAERSFNTFLKQSLAPYVDVYLPQEDGSLMPSLLDSGHSIEQASKIVFRNDLNAIKQADVLLVVLDGRSVDEGACLELGIAYAWDKLCIGLQTDFRRLAPFGNNPMLVGALSRVYSDIPTLTKYIDSLAKNNGRAMEKS